MKYIYTISMCFLLSVFAVKAQQNQQGEIHTFSLQDCINYAIENQDSVKNAKLDIESANYKVKETIGIGLPQVSGSASLQDYLKVPTQLFPDFITPLTYGVLEKEGVKDANGNAIKIPAGAGGFTPVQFGTKYQSSLGLSVSQLIFDGSYLVGLQASKTFKELSQKSYNRTRIATTVSVTKAYYQVVVSDEQIKLLDANINQLKQQLNEVTQMNKQGFVEKIDVDRLTVLYNNLLTTRSNTERLLALGKQVLKFQMGMPVTDDLVVKEKIQDIKLDESPLVQADTTAYKNRIEYSLLETSKKLNELDLKRYKSQFLPSLAAFANGAWQYQNNNFGSLYDTKFPSTVIGLQLNVPIFSGFQKLNRVKQAQIAVQKSSNMLNMAKNGINLQIDQSRIMYTNGLESLNNQKLNMELAREVLRVTRIKYEQGVGSNIEVTQAQTSLQESENNYIQALYNVLISKVDLDSAYGNIK